jgi:phosphatidylglycerophosphate synthase
MSEMPPWDQRLARLAVVPLARTGVTPNQITTFALAVGLTGAALLATGDGTHADWGAGLFILSRFLDHFDGELARLKETPSRFGYYYDYAAGGISYAALFLCMGVGLRGGPLGGWAMALGLAGTAAALISLFVNIAIDSKNAAGAAPEDEEPVGYPAIWGFELEDGIYLLGPITWFGLLQPFFVAAGVGAVVYCLWTLWSLVRLGGGD